jgi:hypothetical protein
VIALAASMSVWSQRASERIDYSAAWQISQQFLATAPAECSTSNSEKMECLAAQRTKAGASPQAVRFTWELYKQSHGDFGIMTGFQNLGVLAFAWITYPLRPNTIYGVVLFKWTAAHRATGIDTLKKCST